MLLQLYRPCRVHRPVTCPRPESLRYGHLTIGYRVPDPIWKCNSFVFEGFEALRCDHTLYLTYCSPRNVNHNCARYWVFLGIPPFRKRLKLSFRKHPIQRPTLAAPKQTKGLSHKTTQHINKFFTVTGPQVAQSNPRDFHVSTLTEHRLGACSGRLSLLSEYIETAPEFMFSSLLT